MPGPDKEKFDSDLQELAKDTGRQFDDLDRRSVTEGIDWAKDMERLDGVELELFGEELVNAVKHESKRVYSELELNTLREQEAFLSVTQRAMSNSIERVEILMQGFEGSDISNEVEVRDFWQRVYGVMNAMDAKVLMYEAAEEMGTDGEAIEGFYRVIEGYIPQDISGAVERTLSDKLTRKDREFMVDQIMALSMNQSTYEVYQASNREVHMANAGLLLVNLKENPKEKAKIMSMLLDKKGGPKVIMDMTVGGYISVSEAEALIDRALKRERDPDRITAMQEVKNFILGETMQAVSVRRVEMQKEILTRLPSIQGHKNQALAKLSYRGIAGTYMKIIAASGLILNVLANWRDPIDGILMNPMVALSLGVGTAGAAIDPSDIGVWPKPGSNLSGLLRDKNDLEDAEQADEFAAFKSTLLNHPVEAELYYNLADRAVNEANRQMTAGKRLGEVEISMSAMGVDYSKLPDRFKTVPQNEMEAQFSEWVQTFMFDDGLDLNNKRSQQAYMNEARDESHILQGRWKNYNLNAAL